MNKLVYTDLLHNAILENGNRPCLHIKREGRYHSWTFNEFHNDLNRLCSVLRKHGLKKGTNAVVIGENTPEWIIAFHAILLTGACTVPIDPNIPPNEIESIIETTEARIVFCSKVYLPLFRTLKEKFNFLERVVVFDSNVNEKEPTFEKYMSHGNEDKEAFSQGFSPNDPMVIIFTSGTTGKAKGVVLCQKNYTVATRYALPRMKMSAEDTVCAVLPLHHVFGFVACIAAPLSTGMDVVFVPHIKGPLILEALRDKGVTMLPAVPKMISLFYDSIMHNIKKKGPLVQTLFKSMKTISATAGETFGNGFRRGLFSSIHNIFGGKLRIIISGGAALNKKYWHGFRQLGFNIVEGYGLTETFGAITLCPLEDPRLGSVGTILEENEIKILDPDASGIGEVLLRGNCVFLGYYKNEALTKEVIDDEGWFHTGDLGYLDKDNFLYIAGRKKDVIVLDTGKNVYPDELEDYYGTSPLIEEIGIFGVKQNEGEIVAAAIVPSIDVRKNNSLQKATDLIYEELIRMGKTQPIHRRISDFVTIYTPLPRTTSKKLKKQELIKLFNSIKRRSGNKSIPEDQLSVLEMALIETDEYKTILQGILTVYPKIDIEIINPRSNLEIDLGIDSLKKIELLSYLERHFLITISENIFDKMETIGDIVTLVREQKQVGKKASFENFLSIKERILADTIEIINFPKSTLIGRFSSPMFKGFIESSSNFKTFNHEKLLSTQNPLIFVTNHNHHLDAFWLINSLSKKIHDNTYFIAEPGTKNYPLMPYILLKDHILTPERAGDPIQILKLSLSVIRNGKNLIVFPEGQMTKHGQINQFKAGVGLLARETGATIIPVLIQSSHSGEEKSQTNIIFGDPFSIPELFAKDTLPTSSTPDELSEYIRSVIISLKTPSIRKS